MSHSIARVASVLALSLAAAGCAFSSSATPVGTAHYAASDRVDVVQAAPPGAVLVGKAEAQGNNYQDEASCRARLVKDARALGATAIVVTSSTGGSFLGKGPHCTADAFRAGGQ